MGKKISFCKKSILVCVALSCIVQTSLRAQKSGQLTRVKNEVVLKNSFIKMIVTDNGKAGIDRKFFAREQHGNWKLVLEGFNPDYSSKMDSAVQLWNMNLNSHRHLITGISGKVVSGKDPGTGDPVVVIKMNHNGTVITERISLKENAQYFHVEVNAAFAGNNPKLDYLISSYKILNKNTPDFVHTPGVKFDDPRTGNGKDQIMGDRTFMAPAAILQQGKFFVSLVPDLNAINNLKVISKDARRNYKQPTTGPFTLPFIDSFFTMPAAIDLNMHSGVTKYPVVTYGLMDAVMGYHTRFVRKEDDASMVRTLASGNAGYEFDLFISTSENSNGYQKIARHQWEKFGNPVFKDDYHLAMPFGEYLNLVNKTIFNPIRNDDGKIIETPGGKLDEPVPGYDDNGSWLQWKVNDTTIGGFRCSAPFWNDVINNSPFWNQAEATVGMYFWGKKLNDNSLVQRSRELINFCLSAPRNEHGLFSTVFSAKDKTWGVSWTDPPNGKNVLFLRNSDTYEIPALCKTGALLLDFYLRVEPDKRIPEYLYPFATWLTNVIDDRGIVPSFVTTDMKSSPILYESAQPSAALWFLAEMYNVTKDEKFLVGAKKIATYLEKEIIPSGKWIDLEQYISCGAKPYSYEKDYWQGQWFRGTLCTIWATEGLAALHRATNDKRWLLNAEKCADYLSFSQCVWKPHYVYTANPFGGIVTDNSDNANMMDQREVELAKPFIYIGKALGRRDLIERGVAAAEAACKLIITPRHVKNKIFNFPLFYPTGVAPENIDHEGLPQSPMRTHPLWGEGSAVFIGLSDVYQSLGGIYINPLKNLVVGADGIKINKIVKTGNVLKIDASSFLSSKFLNQPWEYAYNTEVIIEQNANFKVELNGVALTGKNKFNAFITPDGKITIKN